MGYEKFPDLRYSRMTNLSHNTKRAYAPHLVDLCEAVLNEHGPLPKHGLIYYVNRTYELGLSEDDLYYAVRYAGDNRVIVGHESSVSDGCYRTKAQDEQQTPPSIPAPSSYEAAYYQLYERLQLARQDPQTLYVPGDFLKQAGLL